MANKQMVIINHRNGKEYATKPMTLEEAHEYYAYTLEVGESWQHEKGNRTINRTPKTFQSLITNLTNAKNNAARNGYSGQYFTLREPTAEELATA